MNVRELREKLASFDPEAVVVLQGYEGGYAELEEPISVDIVMDVNIEDYYGRHEKAKEYFQKHAQSSKDSLKAVLLPRELNPLSE